MKSNPFCFTLVVLSLLLLNCYSERILKMPDYTIVNQKGGKIFFPYRIPLKEPITYIFPVPRHDAVGTIDFDNAITLLKFLGESEPEYEIVAKNFLDEVVGDFNFGFSPLFSDELIVYTQTRWAVVANIRSGRVVTPILTQSLDNMIGAIAPLDTARDLFVVNTLIPAKEGSRQMLTLMRYEKNTFVRLGEIDGGGNFPRRTPWLVHHGLIFTYDSSANRVLCHDGELKPSTHPFVEIFNRHSGSFRKLKEMIIHPTLPFGLVVEIGKDIDWEEIEKMPPSSARDAVVSKAAKIREIHALYLLRWDTDDTTQQFIPLHSDTASLIAPFKAKHYGRLSFSPDGKWLVLGHEDRGEDRYGNLGPGGALQPFFVALPVDSQKPLFLGEPIFMGRTLNALNLVTTTAWTTNPTAFVAADGEGLYKWDLGKLHAARTITTPDTLFPLQ
jgi:hypothetical protein